MSCRNPKNCSVSFGWRQASRALFSGERQSPASTLPSVASVAPSVTGGSEARAGRAARQAVAAVMVRASRRVVLMRLLLACASGGAIRFEVGVAGEFGLVETLERLALGDR